MGRRLTNIFRISLLLLCSAGVLTAQEETYCNPVNIDYTYMIYNSHKDISYRSGADPAVVSFRDNYYMFVTRSMGYWKSPDLHQWEFVKPRSWYFEGSNAPAAFNYKDSLLYVAGDPSGSMSIIQTDSPEIGDWEGTNGILYDLQDPAFFIDDDGETYLYWGSSNTYPIRAKKLDKDRRFRPSEEIHELFNLEPEKHGWERFGENHSDTILSGYIEGPWPTKYKGKYYIEYAAPGTEFNVYGDGAYIGEHPLGPFTYAPNNPFSYKPGGFIPGAGHGSTVKGPGGQYWHFASMAVNVNIGWERRIGMFPTFFDEDDLIYTNTYFGDYPHYAPSVPGKEGKFTGWMLLSHNKPVKTSSYKDGFSGENLVDENIKSFWVADTNGQGEWIQIDLQAVAEIRAFQLNYHDYQSDLYGKVPGLFHQYIIEGSHDGKQWEILVDKSGNRKDVPNDYVALEQAASARYIRFKNIHVPTGNLAMSDLRVFGKGSGKVPAKVRDFQVDRKKDRRDAVISWNPVKGASGYNVLWGIAPDKIYSSWQLYGETSLELKSLNTDQTYYFTIEAFNENGISERVKLIETE